MNKVQNAAQQPHEIANGSFERFSNPCNSWRYAIRQG